MKTLNNSRAIKKLGKNELSLLKGGDERNYIVVIIDGIPTKVFL